MTKNLSIIICVFNRFNFTRSCLDSLSQLPNTTEIIVIDNFSSDKTQKQLEDSKEIIYFRNFQNSMFSQGNNIGVTLSSGNNICFLNNDIRIIDKQNWTKPLLEKCETSLVGPTMGLLDSNFNFVKEANQYLEEKYSYLSGWCIASSRENWKKLIIPRRQALSYDFEVPQIWDEQFFYFSDPDLSLRAKQIGLKLNVAKIDVLHFGKVSSKELNVPKLYQEGRKKFIEKWKK